MTADRPVNTVRITRDGREAIVENCTLCGREHRHGAADAALAAGRRSPRAAHCRPERTPEYDLLLAEDADPPEHWQRRFEAVAADV